MFLFSSELVPMAKALTNLNLTNNHVITRKNHYRPSLSYRVPMNRMVTMSYNKSYWESVHEDIEAHLKQAIVVKHPVEVFEPMRHFVFSVPVNMAAALCVAACELVGGHRNQAKDAAAALHVMHAASFVHEHLPLSDRPRLMHKSKPGMYHAFNSNIELLIGDGMIPFGLELLANSDDPDKNNSDRILRVIAEITRTMGSEGVIDGLYNELQCYQSNGKDLNYEEICHHTYEKKVVQLHGCGAACGAILGGGNAVEIERLRRYGFYMGMMQQNFGSTKDLEELKKLALEEIRGFNESKVEDASTFF